MNLKNLKYITKYQKKKIICCSVFGEWPLYMRLLPSKKPG